MTHRLGIAPLFGLALALGVARADSNLDFDVHVTPVTNRIEKGTVEISALTKIEADAAGEILGETTFFFPATPDQIADLLSSPEGVCRLSAICDGVTRTGDHESGKGWTGEMAVDLEKSKNLGAAQRTLWSPKVIERIDTLESKKYSVTFEVVRDDTADARAIHFRLLDGKLFQKLDMTIRVFAGGQAASLVTVTTRTRSSLEDSVADRVLLAKKVLRSSAKVLDDAFGHE